MIWNAKEPEPLGPVLFFRGISGDCAKLSALVLRPFGTKMPKLESETGQYSPELLDRRSGCDIWRFRFTVPAKADAIYHFGGVTHRINADFSGDLRLAFMSCNGQEHGDFTRPVADRNAMWCRLAGQNAQAPFQLLLHGGDQIYADEVTRAHPALHGWPEGFARDLDGSVRAELSDVLDDAYLRRYAAGMSGPGVAELMSSVPSLCIWDDHDICDGWGSFPEDILDSEVGRLLFDAARRNFLLFQFCAGPDEIPEICSDASGTALGWRVDLPDLRILAPDLRSERRPYRVMGEQGWKALTVSMVDAPARTLLVSSVPALGPRLSWVERMLNIIPHAQKYEDDLRDQWQSFAHRDEWRRFLRLMLSVHEQPDRDVTFVSGEIHLATRAEMRSAGGPMHQLVASGITHPAPPPAYALALGALARFGEAPLPAHPIAIRPLPGKRRIYTAERNYLVLSRENGDWSASWELENSGRTSTLPI
ncbi:MAG: alkaline phosphatase D family protein [Pseudomonadota bacterium]